MLQETKNTTNALQCKLCDRIFGAIQILERHMNRKIPCNVILKCEKCNKEFRLKANLIRHQDRKSPCEFMQSNTVIKVEPNKCSYCLKVF
jgi:uncharacterized C2H2 Zn-finger protein